MVTWNRIPQEVTSEMNTIRKFTKDHNREASITICKKPDRHRLFVSSSSKGLQGSTEALGCDLQFGASQRIGDAHTHPVDQDTIGIVPSPSDMTSTLIDSHESARPQISCVTNHISPLVECYEPKEVPNKHKVHTYNHALNIFSNTNNAAYFIDNVGKDFSFAFYDTKSGKKVNKPNPKEVVKAAFGASTKFYKHTVNDLEKAGFCQYIQSFTLPHDDRIAGACVAELKKRDIIGSIRDKIA